MDSPSLREKLDNFYSQLAEWLDRYIFLKYDDHRQRAISKYTKLASEASRLNYLKVQALRPFFMNVLKNLDDKLLSLDGVA